MLLTPKLYFKDLSSIESILRFYFLLQLNNLKLHQFDFIFIVIIFACRIYLLEVELVLLLTVLFLHFDKFAFIFHISSISN
jgi:hypothetical protein